MAAWLGVTAGQRGIAVATASRRRRPGSRFPAGTGVAVIVAAASSSPIPIANGEPSRATPPVLVAASNPPPSVLAFHTTRPTAGPSRSDTGGRTDQHARRAPDPRNVGVLPPGDQSPGQAAGTAGSCTGRPASGVPPPRPRTSCSATPARSGSAIDGQRPHVAGRAGQVRRFHGRADRLLRPALPALACRSPAGLVARVRSALTVDTRRPCPRRPRDPSRDKRRVHHDKRRKPRRRAYVLDTSVLLADPAGDHALRRARGRAAGGGHHRARGEAQPSRARLVRPAVAAPARRPAGAARPPRRTAPGQRRRRHGASRAQPQRSVGPAARLPAARQRQPDPHRRRQPRRRRRRRRPGQQGHAAAHQGREHRAGGGGVPRRAGRVPAGPA